jgi:hypothetical protein
MEFETDLVRHTKKVPIHRSTAAPSAPNLDAGPSPVITLGHPGINSPAIPLRPKLIKAVDSTGSRELQQVRDVAHHEADIDLE